MENKNLDLYNEVAICFTTASKLTTIINHKEMEDEEVINVLTEAKSKLIEIAKSRIDELEEE